jgi:hypothetical protein
MQSLPQESLAWVKCPFNSFCQPGLENPPEFVKIQNLRKARKRPLTPLIQALLKTLLRRRFNLLNALGNNENSWKKLK